MQGTIRYLLIPVVAALTACTGGSEGIATAGLSAPVDSCQIALVPHAGKSPDDKAITRFQTRARSSDSNEAYLERLAWAFVDKSRSSFDPGYLTLAEHSARCFGGPNLDDAAALLIIGHVYHQPPCIDKIGRDRIMQNRILTTLTIELG